MRTLILLLAASSIAAELPDIDPNVFPAADPRAKELPRMMAADARRRMQEACLRESRAFAAVSTRAEWEKHRDERIRALRQSLGEFTPVPADMKVRVMRELQGEGYLLRNVVYESRPGLWVSANLYLPSKTPGKMPGILISHSHHTSKTHGELQDMGMTWARSGVAVLVPDHLGHGERRQHDFHTEKDYDKPFKVGRQDYYFRYNTALQASILGESLMGWMAWDLMRGVDVLLKQTGIDPERIILLGAVAGGGDVAGVTAALDSRIACVAPFNFSGWQPESNAPPDPDRDFAWFGEGYWESTRGLRNGARDGFAHYVIVGSVAPRKVIYAHEFAWNGTIDPAWPRLQKIFGFYDAKQNLGIAHGSGSVRGQPPQSTHCTHIGAVHRKMIYPLLKEWFGMAIPEEYSKRRQSDELRCWTDEAIRELAPSKLSSGTLREMLDSKLAAIRKREGIASDAEMAQWKRTECRRLFDHLDAFDKPKLIEGKSEDVPGGKLAHFALEVEAGILVPFIIISPNDATKPPPVVVMLAQEGKAGFLKRRAELIAFCLEKKVAVCLLDVRGTGETRPENPSPGRAGARTSISQTNLILGRPLLGSQLRDLRTVMVWLKGRKEIDGARIALWGDSFASANPGDAKLQVPWDAADTPLHGEPGMSVLVALAAVVFETDVRASFARNKLDVDSVLASPYIYLPHDSIVPGFALCHGVQPERGLLLYGNLLNSRNQLGPTSTESVEAARLIVQRLLGQ
jgi:dienelactone hydrolase